jgi:catechol 2,3-dioxygenase-like lactoylglutathione lyase family enzyme
MTLLHETIFCAHLHRMHIRAARPTNNLEALRQFYVDGVGLKLKNQFTGHDGFDGLILGDNSFEIEFVKEKHTIAPRAPTQEHLFILYLPSAEVEVRAAKLARMGFNPVKANNPWWALHGITFEDPDGYHFILGRESK